MDATRKRALKIQMAEVAADAIHANFIRKVQSANCTIDVKHYPDTVVVTAMVHEHDSQPVWFEMRVKEVL